MSIHLWVWLWTSQKKFVPLIKKNRYCQFMKQNIQVSVKEIKWDNTFFNAGKGMNTFFDVAFWLVLWISALLAILNVHSLMGRFFFTDHASLMCLNVIGGLLIIFHKHQFTVFTVGIVYLVVFTPFSYLCWFRPAYKAFRYVLLSSIFLLMRSSVGKRRMQYNRKSAKNLWDSHFLPISCCIHAEVGNRE